MNLYKNSYRDKFSHTYLFKGLPMLKRKKKYLKLGLTLNLGEGTGRNHVMPT